MNDDEIKTLIMDALDLYSAPTSAHLDGAKVLAEVIEKLIDKEFEL